MISSVSGFKEKQIKLSKNIKQIEIEIEQKDKQIKEIDDVLKKSDDIQISTLEDKLQRAKTHIKGLERDIAQKEVSIDLAKKSLNAAQTKLQDELKKDTKHRQTSEVASFSSQTLNVAKKIKDEIMHDMREAIQEKTKDQFLSLIEDSADFTNVEIDEDYNVLVTHKTGYKACTTLSAGQQQILALSFMAALNTISGFNNPIVIDTPLARISNTPQENIANKLPKYLPGRQVTLLVLPEKEYTKSLREKISSRIAKEYKIIKGEDGNAEVVDYG